MLFDCVSLADAMRAEFIAARLLDATAKWR
jgi:hypothetical protein